jgi:hypothetical protein
VIACRRQDQVRQLKDTWPVECSCIHKYQLATQLDSQNKTVASIHSMHTCLLRATTLEVEREVVETTTRRRTK